MMSELERIAIAIHVIIHNLSIERYTACRRTIYFEDLGASEVDTLLRNAQYVLNVVQEKPNPGEFK
jgi:hypothetical protein